MKVVHEMMIIHNHGFMVGYVLYRGVVLRKLIYGITPPVLPTFLFTSESLMTLKLDIDYDRKVPCKVWLPHLKSLYLERVRFLDGDSMHRLISGCLALEDLIMDLSELPRSKPNIQCLSLKRLSLDFSCMFTDSLIDFNYTFVITAPNLVYFKCYGPLAKGYCLNTMNSLEKADVEVYQLDIKPSYDVNHERGATAAISNLLQGICNVKFLHLAIEEPETLIRVPLEPVLGFHKLVELELKVLTIIVPGKERG